jgi:hypothetical protein
VKLRKQFAVLAGVIVRVGTVWGGRGPRQNSLGRLCGRTAIRMKAIKMRRLLAASALMVVATVVPASADAVPTLNLDAICRGIAAHATSPGEAGGPDLSFRQCVNQELRIRNRLIKSWTTFSAKSKAECVGEATAGGLSSYTDLLTCLQLTRDVEKMRHKER